MGNNEQVIKGLEKLKETIRTANQYTFTSGSICAMNMKRVDNAIELLKQQKAQKDRIIRIIRETLHQTHSIDTEEDQNFVCELIEHRIWHTNR